MNSNLVSPVTRVGRHFVCDGKKFKIKGIVYQTSSRAVAAGQPFDYDPLRPDCQNDLCKDIVLLKELGVNAISVYSLRPSENHDTALRTLAAAGIYVLVGLSTPHACINRMDPHSSYTETLLNQYFAIVDELSSHVNILGVVAANVVINDAASTKAAEVIRAVIRDVKGYMRWKHQQNGQRILPIGISDDGFAASSAKSIDYFTAGTEDERIDFYSFTKYNPIFDANNYWAEEVKLFQEKGVPVFVSEYNSGGDRPRHFKELDSLYRTDTASVLSGGFVYEYMEGPNAYGLVTPDGQVLQDYRHLQKGLMGIYGDLDLDLDLKRTSVEGTSPRGFPDVSDVWRATDSIPATISRN